ncbi:MAG: magnesium transporter [Acidobacteriota bacterium]
MTKESPPTRATEYRLNIDLLLLPEIREMLDNRQFDAVKSLLNDLFPQDIADLIDDLEEPHRGVLFRLLPKELSVEVFDDLSSDSQLAVISALSDQRVSEILDEMSDDERVELLEESPPAAVRKLLTLLTPEQHDRAVRSLGYPEDSVGRMMTPDFVDLDSDMTVEQALSRIRQVGLKKETVYTCYVTDHPQQLLGVVSLRKLVTADPAVLISELMNTNVLFVSTITDQEEAARIVKHYDLIALPVVDSQQRLVGIVTFDDLMDVVEEEVTEDFQRLAAVVPTDESYFDTGFITMARKRIFWLFLLLVLESASGQLLHHYSAALQAMVALSFFIPMLIATGGNAGTQSATLIIRGLATGEIHLRDFGRLLFRECMLGITLGVLLSIVAFGRAYLLESDVGLGLTVAVSLAITLVAANVIGALLPLLLRALGLDPALVAAPTISTLVDVFGLWIYFEVARRILTLEGI